MATVNVTSWAQFVQAIAVSGDTVVLPSGALWDMNEIAPEGVSGDIPINCAAINGRNTEIRNLHLYGKFIVPADLVFNDLKMANMVCEDTAFFDNDENERTITMNGSTFTGIFGVNTLYFNKSKMSLNRSVVNVDMTAGGTGSIFFCWDTFSSIYSRVTLNYPSSSGSLWIKAAIGGIKYTMFTANCIGCINFDSRVFSGCVIRGNYGQAYDMNDYGYHGAFVSVYDSAAFADDFTTENPYFKPVTQAQLYDATYLASIGFPIGV